MHAGLATVCALALAVALSACSRRTEGSDGNRAETGSADAAIASLAAAEGARIMERSRAAEEGGDNTLKVRARVTEPNSATREIRMTTYRKRESDGRRLMFLEITSPAEERDRSGLVSFTPQGDIEATRYMQGSNSFAISKSANSEDSLFGMSLQELADGQPEKYDQRLVGEETAGPTAAYKIEGKLKPGAESNFARVVTIVSRENLTVLRVDYYDNHDQPVRRLTVDRVEQIDGHWTRMKWTIDNLSRGKRIEFETLSIKHERSLPSSVFSREHLKESASR